MSRAVSLGGRLEVLARCLDDVTVYIFRIACAGSSPGPRQLKAYLSMLSFNYLPLSGLLVVALSGHPELAPGMTLVRWIAKQRLIGHGESSRRVKRWQ